MSEEDKYKMDLDDKTEDKDKKESAHDRAVRHLDTIRNLDENNPQERSIKFNTLKHHMPRQGYMEVKTYEGEDENGEPVIISESKYKNKVKKLVHSPFFVIDLLKLVEADVASCPMHIMPNLISEYVQVALEEKKVFKPEKRNEGFNWWWIVFFLLMMPGIVLIILLMM